LGSRQRLRDHDYHVTANAVHGSITSLLESEIKTK